MFLKILELNIQNIFAIILRVFFNAVLFNSNLTDEKDKNESLTFLGPVDVACMSTSHPQTPGW